MEDTRHAKTNSTEQFVFPLSYAQQRMWLIEQLTPGTHAFNIPIALRLCGQLDCDRLERCLQAIQQRHESLRTTFAVIDGSPQQVITEAVNAKIEIETLEHLPESKRETALQELGTKICRQPFDLSSGPLMRATFIRLAPEEHIFILNLHHIVADGWSLGLLFGELAHYYAAFEKNASPSLPELPIQYADYAEWERQYLQGAILETKVNFWKTALAGAPPELKLPLDRNIKFSETDRGAYQTFDVPAPLTRQLEKLAQQEGCTLFMLLMAAFQVLLSRYSGQSDIVVGTPLANRMRPEVEQLIGCFMNPMPMRARFDDNPGFRQLLNQVKHYALRAFAHQDLPFELLIKALPIPRDLETPPLFSALFMFQNYPAADFRLPGLEVTPVEFERSSLLYPVALEMHKTGDKIVAHWEYLADLYDSTLRDFPAHMLALLESVVEKPDQPVSRLAQAAVEHRARKSPKTDELVEQQPDESSDGDIEDLYELSPMQKGILFESLATSEREAYFIQLCYRLSGEMQPEILERAISRIVARHPVLRTSFHWQEIDNPLQVVHRQVTTPFDYIDIRQEAAKERQEHFRALLNEDRRRGFRLDSPPLMRFMLVQIDHDDWRLVWSYHHILLEGWSAAILFDEFMAVYDAEIRRTSVKLPARRPYREFIQWLLEQDRAERDAFWHEQLHGYSKPVLLPMDRSSRLGTTEPAAAEQEQAATGLYAEHEIRLSAELTRSLHGLARRYQLTLASLLQAAYAVAIARLSGETDVVFGSVVSGRNVPLPGIEDMVGLFINTLPARLTMQGSEPFISLARRVHAAMVAARRFEHSALHEVQKCSRVPVGARLFEYLFIYENWLGDLQSRDPDRALQVLDVESFEGGTGYPLTLVVEPGDNVTLAANYDCRRFTPAAIERLLGHLHALLTGIAGNPEQPMHSLPLLSPGALTQIVESWNQTQSNPDQDVCVHSFFEQQARRTPDAIAVAAEEQPGGGHVSSISYGRLLRQARFVARQLQACGVRPEQLVGLCAERRIEMIIGILGILFAGAAYVPIDPKFPEQRIRDIIADAGMQFALTDRALADRFAKTGARVFCLEEICSQATNGAMQSINSPSPCPLPENLAYVIYTSGSTGRPKGVMIEHRNLVNYTRHAIQHFGLRAEDRVLQFASISFDTAAEEIYPALACGATLVLRNDEMLVSAGRFFEKCRAWQITVLDLPTAYWHELVDKINDEGVALPKMLRLVILGGERALPQKVSAWLRTTGEDCILLNTYGPTEATIVTTSAVLTSGPPDDGNEPPIGRPVANARAYVVDTWMQPVPIDVPGELYIGGAGVARGYLKRPDLTAEKFIPEAFAGSRGSRLYQSGDLARWRPSGNLEFLGRRDHQVKIRGFRVELGEIETVLLDHPEIVGAVVELRKLTGRGDALVAYVQSARLPGPEKAALRAFLQKRLPEYMVPAAFVLLDALPLTPQGKIDRRALPEPERERQVATDTFVPPRTELERAVAEVWQQALNLQQTGSSAQWQIGVHDNFFELGGHSLLALRVISRLSEQLGIEIALRTLFEFPTIAGLAQKLEVMLLETEGMNSILEEIEQLSDEEARTLLGE